MNLAKWPPHVPSLSEQISYLTLTYFQGKHEKFHVNNGFFTMIYKFKSMTLLGKYLR